MKLAQEVVDWLKKLPNVQRTNITPVVVTFHEKEFEGVFYTENSPYQAGMDAVVRGSKSIGDACHTNRFYLVGKIPLPALKGHHCYRIAGQENEWYVSSYFDPKKSIEEIYKPYHPFGHTFMLGEWSFPDLIDANERCKYTRHPVNVKT